MDLYKVTNRDYNNIVLHETREKYRNVIVAVLV
jgi:hypothetical protein